MLRRVPRLKSLATTTTPKVISGRSVWLQQSIAPLSLQTVCRRAGYNWARQSPTLTAISIRSFAVVTENLESLGDSISTAVLLSWNKEPGDSIKEDDVIAVVETDKVTMDIRAKKSGVFLEGLAKEQDEITVGNSLYKMDTSATEAHVHSEATPPPPKMPESSEKPAATGKKTTVPVPVMGESITTGSLASWTVKAGDHVKMDDVVATIETDKVNVEVRSPDEGTIVETYAGEGDEVNVGDPLFVLALGEGSPDTKPASKEQAPKEDAAPPKKESAPAAPKSEAPAPPKKAAPAPSKESSPKKDSSASNNISGDRSETRVKMTRMRQRIAQRLKESQNTAAMLTTFQEVDMTNLIELRNKYKEEFEKVHNVKLGFMSAFVRACTTALTELPAVNAVIDDSTQELVYRNYVDVSVAVASPSGLVVPVLRNTEKMGFADVEKTIAMYGKKAKEGTLALEEMAGGTFTISNGGVFGSLFGTPIINPPQSAILGMHATKMRAVVVNGKVEARPMMYLALSYDHRMIDGREAVTFLKSVAAKIEDPRRLLLSL